MPKFYTHSRSGTRVAEDKEGEAFDDLKSARRAARQAGREMASDEVFMGADEVDVELSIDNAAGDLLSTVSITGNIVCTETGGCVPVVKEP